MFQGHFSLFSNRIVEYSKIIILVCEENAKFAFSSPRYNQIILMKKSMSILKLKSSISKLLVLLTKHDVNKIAGINNSCENTGKMYKEK